MDHGRIRLLPLLVIVASSAVALHIVGRQPWLRIDWSHLATWSATTPPTDVLAALARIVALGLAYWVLLSTAAYLLARLSGLPAAIRAVRGITIPALRRIVDAGLTVSLAATLVSPPGSMVAARALEPATIELEGAAQPSKADTGRSDVETEDQPHPTVPENPEDEVLPPGLQRIGWLPRPAGRATGPTGGAAGMGDGSDIDRSPRANVVVAPGVHLWSIAEEHVGSQLGQDANATTVARYWRQVIEANRSSLRSGDPDLIYPGEIVVLPTTGDLP